MRVSEIWLREFVNPPLDTDGLVKQLTMAGLEVDAVEPVAGEFQRVVIGEIASLDPHPDADRLRICRLNVGQSEPLQVVTGAQNVYVGMRVPVALDGAQLPGGITIKPSKLRGVPSHGMLCSEKELGMAEAAEGVMDLPQEAPVGGDIRAYLQLDDRVIEVELTPNRADCLSVEGVAREVAALNGMVCTPLAVAETAITHGDTWTVTVSAPVECPCYLGRLIKGVDSTAITPLWMAERLRRAGLRSLGPVVDVTNYVLLEMGQPLHAFDAAKVQGGIHVRKALAGETLALLNEQTIKLDANTLVIADAGSPLALAGIMGGKTSAVSDDTADIFLECAFFDPAAMMGEARRYGLHTDSSHRFERGVDPAMQQRAIERATQLILSLAGGQAGPITEQTSAAQLPASHTIELRAAKLGKILGLSLATAQVSDLLRRLGMTVEATDAGWRVTPPSYRFDVAIEVDLIEEIARIYGYDRLPRQVPVMGNALLDAPEGQLPLDRSKDLLVDRGYQEAITYSFVDPAMQQALTPDEPCIALKNPISADLAVMRTQLWAGLLHAARHNQARQEHRIRLFESGLRFQGTLADIRQEPCLAGLALGPVWPQQWADKARAVDFYDVKADVEALLSLTGRADAFQFQAAQHPALHPGQSAAIVDDAGRRIGWLGLLHPHLEKTFDFTGNVFLFELELAALSEKRLPSFHLLSRFPSMRRDLALVIDAQLAAGHVQNAILTMGNALIQSVCVFDVYSGPGVESGSKSLALTLLLQDTQDTLTDERVDTVITDVLEKLHRDFGAKLRD
ncbi:MAG: phenylalanine--tRNA ligase subunit beta [Methylococcaceae bacterium]|nr:MAG: phenylalanine--tRNA ligase subunit beta [Methylococcaceae bacterium]